MKKRMHFMSHVRNLVILLILSLDSESLNKRPNQP